MAYEDDEKSLGNNDQENNAEDLDEIVKEIQKKLKAGRTHMAKKRQEMREAFDYYAGLQWSEVDKGKLDDQGRPAIVLNRIPRVINAVCGLEVQNRQEATLHPRHVEQSGSVDYANDAVKWVREACDAEDEDSEVFRDSVICGYGFSETSMDYETNPDGDIKICRHDPGKLLYDPSATKKNLIDAKWFAHEVDMTIDEIKSQFGDVDLDGIVFDGSDESDGSPHRNINGDQYTSGINEEGEDIGEKKIKVTHFQDYKVVQMYRAQNPMTGQLEKVSIENFDKLRSVFPQMKGVKTPVRIYYKTFIIGNTIVERDELKCEQFTFNIMTGLYDRNRNIFFGLVELMRDAQMWQNKFFSQILHILNSNAKGGLIIEEGSQSDPKTFEQNWAKADSITYVTPGSLSNGRVQPKPQTPYPQGLDHLMTYAQSAITNVAGVSEEFLGNANRDQPYVLEYQRQKQGILILSPFFDSARRYRKTGARLNIKYIRDYISDGRLIRIMGQNGAQYIPLMRDKLALEYDVLVGDAPTSSNMKERVFEVLSTIIPMALQAGIPVPPEVLDYAPLPDALAQTWKQRINQPDPVMQELQQLKVALAKAQTQQTELENQKIAAEVGVVMSEIPLNQAKAQQAQAQGLDLAALADQRNGVDQHDMQLKQQDQFMQQAMDRVDMLMKQKLAEQDMHMTNQRKWEEAKLNAAVKLKTQKQAQSNAYN